MMLFSIDNVNGVEELSILGTRARPIQGSDQYMCINGSLAPIIDAGKRLRDGIQHIWQKIDQVDHIEMRASFCAWLYGEGVFSADDFRHAIEDVHARTVSFNAIIEDHSFRIVVMLDVVSDLGECNFFFADVNGKRVSVMTREP